MSKRSTWCEFDKEERKYIKKRDNNECVICHSKGALQIMHIFVSRAKGGHGVRQNGCLGCIKCHKLIDNPIGTEEVSQSLEMIKYCKNYLIEKEHITDIDNLIESLKYKKIIDPIKIEIPMFQDKCKGCIYLSKNKYPNSSINSYYCRLEHKAKSKNSIACSFKEC